MFTFQSDFSFNRFPVQTTLLQSEKCFNFALIIALSLNKSLLGAPVDERWHCSDRKFWMLAVHVISVPLVFTAGYRSFYEHRVPLFVKRTINDGIGCTTKSLKVRNCEKRNCPKQNALYLVPLRQSGHHLWFPSPVNSVVIITKRVLPSTEAEEASSSTTVSNLTRKC